MALLVGGCASFESAGEPAETFITREIWAAYLPLHGWGMFEHRAAATIVAPGIAATNAHNANLVAPDVLIGKSTDYDLLFFHAPGHEPPPMAAPQIGETVLAYGQGAHNDLRVAHGVVRGVDVALPPNCPGCAAQQAIAIEADAGKGFSGGPVVDAKTGALLGIVFAFRASDESRKERMIYAYDMARVAAELARVSGPRAADQR